MSKPEPVLYRCTRCGVKFNAGPGPQRCIICGSEYLERPYETPDYGYGHTVGNAPGTRGGADRLERTPGGLAHGVSGVRYETHGNLVPVTPTAPVR